MKENTLVETFGYIIKIDQLETIESNILRNTFVLESSKPYPGYHGSNLPSESIPHHLFMVTKEKYSEEIILRKSQRIRQYFEHSFGARKAELNIFNNTYTSIRIKDLSSFSYIPELQRCYQNEGIEFLKKKSFNEKAVIKVQKHFRLNKIGDGIYKDLDDLKMYYINIPHQIMWYPFEHMTISIKNNLENNNFDAALGVLYLHDLIDVIRIVEESCTIERLETLKALFMEEIRKAHL